MPEAIPLRPGASNTLRALRREEILDVASALVAEGGLAALTVAALEARLDYTRGVITYHFLGKDEIVSALLARAIDRIDRSTAAAVRDGPGRSRLTAATRAMVDGFLREPAACAILIAFWSRLRSDPAARAVNAGLYQGWRERAEILVRELAPRLGARRRAAIAALLVGQVIGIVTQAIFDPGAIAVDDAVHEAGRALEGAVGI